MIVTQNAIIFIGQFMVDSGLFSLYIYFIFVNIFRAFLPAQPGRVFAGVFLQGFLGETPHGMPHAHSVLIRKNTSPVQRVPLILESTIKYNLETSTTGRYPLNASKK